MMELPEQVRTLAQILDEIANEALESGDQPILDLIEEACDLLGFDESNISESGKGVTK